MSARKITDAVPAERMHFGFRCTPEMKQAIEEAAGRSGRSMSQEVEFRLERSFDREELLPDALTLAYGPELGATLLLIGNAMVAARNAAAEGEWLTDTKAFEAVTTAAGDILGALHPAPATDVTTHAPGARMAALAIAGDPRRPRLSEAAEMTYRSPVKPEKIRAMLGPLVERLKRLR